MSSIGALWSILGPVNVLQHFRTIDPKRSGILAVVVLLFYPPMPHVKISDGAHRSLPSRCLSSFLLQLWCLIRVFSSRRKINYIIIHFPALCSLSVVCCIADRLNWKIFVLQLPLIAFTSLFRCPAKPEGSWSLSWRTITSPRSSPDPD